MRLMQKERRSVVAPFVFFKIFQFIFTINYATIKIVNIKRANYYVRTVDTHVK